MMLTPFGLVHVVRRLRTGDIADEWMSVERALHETDWLVAYQLEQERLANLRGKKYENEVISLHIDWGDVSAANRDTSGGALAAEYSNLRLYDD